MQENTPKVGFRLLFSALALVALGSTARNARAENSRPSVTFEASLGSVLIEPFSVKTSLSRGDQHVAVEPVIGEAANLVSES